MATFDRRQYVGAAAAGVTLAADIAAGSTTFTMTPSGSASTYPDGSTGPFEIVLNRGHSTEEKIKCSTRSGVTFNVAASGRGHDGTSAAAHSAGETLEHCVTAIDLDEANQLVNQTLGNASGNGRKALLVNSGGTGLTVGDSLASLLTAGGDTAYASAANTPARLAKGTGLQYYRMNAGATAPEWATLAAAPTTATFSIPHTWTISGAIAVPSGDTNFINPMFVARNSTETVVLDKVRYIINSGTSVTFKMQVNGADATGFTAISCTTTAATTDPANVTLADLDKLVPVVTAVSGAPVNMTITAFLLHTVTLA